MADESWQENDRVLAEWENNAWYTGRIASSCNDGFRVLYDDGDTKCANLFEIVANDVPAAIEVEVGTLVLAQWGSAFYPAKVAEIEGSEYYVDYFDGDSATLELSQIRVLTGDIAKRNDFSGTVSSAAGSGSEASSSPEEKVLDDEIEIWQGGSRWATIETAGTIWIDSSSVGEIESDGDLWRSGSRIAEIESNGDIYLGGSSWGEAYPFGGTPQELRVVAAVLVFFAEDFGFYE